MQERDFLSLTEPTQRAFRRHKAPLAIIAIGSVIDSGGDEGSASDRQDVKGHEHNLYAAVAHSEETQQTRIRGALMRSCIYS
jgi:hypothetical protein